MDFSLKMLTLLEKDIFRAFEFGEAENTQGIYKKVCWAILFRCRKQPYPRNPDNYVEISPIFVSEEDLDRAHLFKASEARREFKKLQDKYRYIKLPSYSRIQRYLMKFVKNGWLESRQFGKKKNSLAFWIPDKIRDTVLKEDKEFWSRELGMRQAYIFEHKQTRNFPNPKALKKSH